MGLVGEVEGDWVGETLGAADGAAVGTTVGVCVHVATSWLFIILKGNSSALVAAAIASQSGRHAGPPL